MCLDFRISENIPISLDLRLYAPHPNYSVVYEGVDTVFAQMCLRFQKRNLLYL